MLGIEAGGKVGELVNHRVRRRPRHGLGQRLRIENIDKHRLHALGAQGLGPSLAPRRTHDMMPGATEQPRQRTADRAAPTREKQPHAEPAVSN
jgi:hypothetical protein